MHVANGRVVGTDCTWPTGGLWRTYRNVHESVFENHIDSLLRHLPIEPFCHCHLAANLLAKVRAADPQFLFLTTRPWCGNAEGAGRWGLVGWQVSPGVGQKASQAHSLLSCPLCVCSARQFESLGRKQKDQTEGKIPDESAADPLIEALCYFYS